MKTKGWQKVLGFTLVQYIKTKSFIISTIIICVLVAAVCVLTNILPLMLGADEALGGMFGGGSSEDLEEIYLIDSENILTDEDLVYAAQLGAVIKPADRSEEQITEALAEDESAKALVILTRETYPESGGTAGYFVKVYFSAGAKKESAADLSEIMTETVERRKLANLGVAPEDFEESQAFCRSQTVKAGEKEINNIAAFINYIVPVVVSLVLFMLIFVYGNTIAQSIATEKTSRVMELLLTSIRPLAVVIGKVLAMGIVSFGQFILIGTVGSISFAVSAPFGITGKIASIMADPAVMETIKDAGAAVGTMSGEEQAAQAISSIMNYLNPINIFLVILIFLLGFLFFSLLAALVGASISRMEDLQTAMTPYSLSGVVGLYLAYFPVIFNADALESGTAATNPVQIFSYYFPLSSPFALPSAILLGIMDTVQAAIAVLILAAAVVLIAIVVSKVYEAIILHNGNRIKMSDILKMAMRK